METLSSNISHIKLSKEQLLKLIKISEDLPDLQSYDLISDNTDVSVVVLDFITINLS